LAKKYGALGFLGWGMLINSVFGFLVPVAARHGGVFWLIVVRFIQGLGEGPIVPCTHAMLVNKYKIIIKIRKKTKEFSNYVGQVDTSE
jgi:MFS family permease